MIRLAAVAVIALALLGAAPPQQAIFSSRVEAVRVDVLVTDGGRPVRDLGPEDFEVLDNGVPQLVDLVSFEQLPLNVVLTLDMSDSVVGERLEHLRAASRGLLDGLRDRDQAALIVFSQMVTVASGLTADIAGVRAAVEQTWRAGESSVVDASYAGMMIGESEAGRALVIVFSDGLDTSSWLRPDLVLGIAARCDAVVYGVSAGLASRSDFLRRLTDQSGGRLFEVESTKNLPDVFLQVLDEFRQRYLVSYSPRGVPGEGWHRLSVRVKRPGLAVKARPGYFAGR